jgi:hypothetical protein
MVDGGMGRRIVESEWDRLAQAADAFRSEHPNIRDLNVGLMFRGPVPPRRQHAEFIAEVAAFIRGQAAELQSEDMEYWPPAFSSPLMLAYLRTLYLRRDRYAVWYSNLAAGWVGRPDPTLAAIVEDKSRKRFRPCDELWLAIQGSARISEMLSDILGVEDFEVVPGLEPYVFSRVFVLAFTGTYQWKRGEGWRQLTGENQEAEGPSLDGLKAVLKDPEWLADPDARAEQVAAEVLQELRARRDGYS